jgi:hypothetical protein
MQTLENEPAPQIERYPGEEIDRLLLAYDIAQRPEEERTIIERALERYDQEGEVGSYESNPGNLIEFIVKEKLLEGSSSLVDLGAGPGDLIEALRERLPGIQTLGIDLSPSFVEKFNVGRATENSAMRMGLIDSPGLAERVGDLTGGGVISVLTLDRVADPRRLIKNMGEFRGPKILGTLIPIVAEDDNPSRQGEEKIVYTPQGNRVAPGTNPEEDRDALRTFLLQEWKEGIENIQLPYAVGSSGDLQEYVLDVFFTRPAQSKI